MNLKGKLESTNRNVYIIDEASMVNSKVIRNHEDEMFVCNIAILEAIKNFIKSGNIKNKVTNELADAFVGIDYGDVEDADKLYLVERVLVGDEIYTEPIKVWTVDVRVFKAVLMRKLAHSGMKEDDLKVIIFKHMLYQYYSSAPLRSLRRHVERRLLNSSW